MDSTKGEKLQAMHSFKNSQFLQSLILHSLIALTCSLLCSCFYGISSLNCTMNHFLFTSLPNISAFFVKPKCLFIVVNVIVVFLVGESRLFDSKLSPASDLYDEYVERSHSLRGQYYGTSRDWKAKRNSETDDNDGYIKQSLFSSTHEDRSNILPEEKEDQRKLEMILIEDMSTNMIEGKEVMKDQDQDQEGEEKDHQVKGEVDQEDDEDQEMGGLPAEELKKRADEFIARVNKQMWLEANLMVCAKA